MLLTLYRGLIVNRSPESSLEKKWPLIWYVSTYLKRRICGSGSWTS